MKSPYLIIAMLLFSISSKAQPNDDDNKIFIKVEHEATFPGGDAGYRKFLEKNLNPDVPINNNAPAGNYTVMIEFIVSKGGTVSNITALTHYGYGMEEECIKAIKKTGKWTPAMQNGKAVNAYRRQPFTFQIEEPDEKEDDQYSKDTIEVYKRSDQMPMFPGGVNEWMRFLQKTINPNIGCEVFSDTAYFLKHDIETYNDLKANPEKKREITAISEFTICKDGSVCWISLTNKVHPLIKAEVKRVLTLSPKWIPANVNGVAVDSHYREKIKQPIVFSCD